VSSETVPVIRIRHVTKRYTLGDIEVQALRRTLPSRRGG